MRHGGSITRNLAVRAFAFCFTNEGGGGLAWGSLAEAFCVKIRTRMLCLMLAFEGLRTSKCIAPGGYGGQGALYRRLWRSGCLIASVRCGIRVPAVSIPEWPHFSLSQLRCMWWYAGVTFVVCRQGASVQVAVGAASRTLLRSCTCVRALCFADGTEDAPARGFGCHNAFSNCMQGLHACTQHSAAAAACIANADDIQDS